MLAFSLTMWQQSKQVEGAMRHVLDTRMYIRDQLDAIAAQANGQVSEARGSVIRHSELTKDKNGQFPQEIAIWASFQQLDSLESYLSDSVDLTELEISINKFNQDFYVADSLWQATLEAQKNTAIRLNKTDPAQTHYRVASAEEQNYSLPSDTVAELTIEAEEAYMQGAFLNYTHANYRGKGYADYTNKDQDVVEWKFETEWSGTHLISFRYANGGKSDRPLRIELDSLLLDSALSFPVTERGAWTQWVFTETIPVSLNAGGHTLHATAIGSSGANIDFVKIVTPAPYADSSLLNNTVYHKGVMDEEALAEFMQQVAGQQDAANTMNAIADILRNAGVKLRRAISSIRAQNESLLASDMAQLQDTLYQATLFNFGMLVAVILLAAFATSYVLKSMKNSIAKPTQFIYQLAEGKVNDNLVETKDELNEVVQAGNLLGQQLRKARDFAIQVGDGQLDQPFEPASEQDMLGNALLQMRTKLVEMAEEEKNRHWMNEGITKFSELVRAKYEDKQEFAVKLVSEVVKYVGANQGGLFIREQGEGEGDEVLVLQGCYAYERRKFIEKDVIPGEGLLGQAYLEGETTYLTEIPDKYITIRSGLGQSDPNAILIVPLTSNEQLTGVLELATFREFTPHAIELVEKVAEIIGAHIANLEANERTQQLLKSTQEQAEELRSQEEEMRQNMEEMKAIQEQMHRDQQEEQQAVSTDEAKQT
ncbi:GAF domain-containing protein [Tunicatimonas pelagia]|uniref:GAF domain-containing protein n=1 Tax=Tunicatimonas pelagia TaxID=931531 RepID=UPI002665EFBD|nr:GAF domain-containing protein [Tunicatimonas pelagia]WKN45939.1 GAF domain-containing protein [Tunicatimonas pelagia]